MSGKNESSHATKISHQLHKSYNISQRGADTSIQQVVPVPARGYITYSSPEIRDHRGDGGQWQTQPRYDYPSEEILARDHRASDYYGNRGNSQLRSDYPHSYHNQRPPNSSNDPIFDEFLKSLMESFNGYENPSIISYHTQLTPPPVGYNVPKVSYRTSYHSVATNAPRGHDFYSRPEPDWPSPIRETTSHRPEYRPWPPGPRDIVDRYPQVDEKHHYGQPFPTKQTQFNYPISPDARSEAQWKHPDMYRLQNGRYRDHQYSPPPPTNQMQLRSTPPQQNSVRPGDGYMPTEEDETTWKTPNVGYKYPTTLAKGNATRPEMETGWEVKDNKQHNLGDKISNMGMGALNYAKRNLYPGPALPENGNIGPDSTNHWQEDGNTRPELANHHLETNPDTGAPNSTLKNKFSVHFSKENLNAFSKNPGFSQEIGHVHPETSNQPNNGDWNSTGGALDSHQETVYVVPEASYGSEVTKQPNITEKFSKLRALDTARRSLAGAPDSQESGYVFQEASNGSEASKHPNIAEKFSKLGVMNSSRKNQFPSLFSKEK